MVNQRGREGRVQGCGVLQKLFWSFTRCWRRNFLYVDGVLNDSRDGVMFLLALRRLRRYLFFYLSSKLSTSCSSAFQLQHLRPGTPGRYVGALITVLTIGI